MFKIAFRTLLKHKALSAIQLSGLLEDFAYHVPVSWSIFLATGAISIVFATTLPVFHVTRAALANPIITLRTD